MKADRPTHLVDPVCGMTVAVDAAEAADLLFERDGRTYAFCRDGCRRVFLDAPDEYVGRAEGAGTASPATRGDGGALPVIDEGIRRWYESCSCCLSDAYPEIKAQLDAERAAVTGRQPPVGICEVAEAADSPL